MSYCLFLYIQLNISKYVSNIMPFTIQKKEMLKLKKAKSVLTPKTTHQNIADTMLNIVALRHSVILMPMENIERPVSSRPETIVNNQRVSSAALYSYIPYVMSPLKSTAIIVFIMSIFIVISLI